jgi:hypothetical protein
MPTLVSPAVAVFARLNIVTNVPLLLKKKFYGMCLYCRPIGDTLDGNKKKETADTPIFGNTITVFPLQ